MGRGEFGHVVVFRLYYEGLGGAMTECGGGGVPFLVG
ncbi:hypothetical protein TcasGA2_TC031896 [Tribolium castaneum]|uniref:Uncharacterized protein n=1 Tax=Tribolium castaneum TaxID=7070 RepID=A0A139W8Z4_TRICA|nr:hypothetical protein TcasGA2_TC031896 [Tribolium castaneum]